MRGRIRSILPVSVLLLLATAAVLLGETVTVVDVSQLTFQPRAIYNPIPRYPPEMMAKKIAGKAVIDFICRTDGSTDRIKVVSATNLSFGKAAADAIAIWKYRPAEYQGHPVNCQLEVPFLFTPSP